MVLDDLTLRVNEPISSACLFGEQSVVSKDRESVGIMVMIIALRFRVETSRHMWSVFISLLLSVVFPSCSE